MAGDPAVAVGASEDAIVDLPTGVRMHYIAQGAPEGRALILLHGYTDSGVSFRRVLPLLPEELRVIVPDLRGHGRSSRPDAEYSMNVMSRDVAALMDALGVHSATVVGHSMGSFVAQQLAAEAPARVEGMVLVGAALSIHALPGLDEFRASVRGLEDPVPEEFVRSFQESTVLRPVPAAFMDAVVAESMQLPARVWAAVLEGMIASPQMDSSGRKTRTLLVSGVDDPFFGPEQQERLLHSFDRVRLIAFPGVGHAPHWEEPERFARDLLAFLAGDGPGRTQR
jgi:pimeloyl-ACP methyl ester carboxylesterase